MRIGELGQATGVDVETIRFYEKSGLLPPPARSGNGYRTYGPTHLERLAFVRHCRALDIPLNEVKRLLEFVEQPNADCGDIDQLIDTQLAKVRARLKSLKVLEKQLASLRGRCGAKHIAGECGILHELVAAAHK
jgi:Cd(II)/Pb(II)-responsive transcriptional regulator